VHAPVDVHPASGVARNARQIPVRRGLIIHLHICARVDPKLFLFGLLELLAPRDLVTAAAVNVASNGDVSSCTILGMGVSPGSLRLAAGGRSSWAEVAVSGSASSPAIFSNSSIEGSSAKSLSPKRSRNSFVVL
jgi:hypothetical protein